MEKVANFIDLVLRQQRTASTRRLVVVSGERDWLKRQIAALDSHLSCDPVCCLSSWLMIADKDHGLPLTETLKPIAGKQAHQILGREFPGILFDVWGGFNPNAFGQVCGTLVAGGVMIVLAPPLSDWPAFADPEHHSLITGSGSIADVGNRFIQHLVGVIQADTDAVVLQQHEPLPSLPSTSVSQNDNPVVGVSDSENGVALTADQQRIVSNCVEHFKTSEKQVTVITADRGRGKSAALGLIAAELMLSETLNILVTAPGRGAVESLFTMLKPQCQAGGVLNNKLQIGQSRLRFMLPDQLLNEQPEADLLLVDEAAAIPAPVLRQLLEYDQVIYASTIHGYEGTGQGFAVRFLNQLSVLRSEWRHLRMTQPIRWSEGDPLEAFCYKALLLDAEPVAADELSLSGDAISCRRLDRDELLQQPALLKQVFGLLILAHYRTTPGDLRILLDSPNLQVWIAETIVKGEIVPVATALLAEEGPIEEALAQEIRAGRRRPKGQLIPQTLLAHSQIEDAGRYKGLRIMRIAVLPELQRQRIGQQLVDAIGLEALSHYDWLGTSFGLTSGLLRFWQTTGMALVRLGHKRDKVSATHAAVMLKALSPAAADLQYRASTQCALQLRELQEQGSEIAAGLLDKISV